MSEHINLINLKTLIFFLLPKMRTYPLRNKDKQAAKKLAYILRFQNFHPIETFIILEDSL